MTATTASVLVVDDHADTGHMIQRALLRQGIDSEIAVDGEAALQLLATVNPEVVILDQTMPGMTGLEVLMRMRLDPQSKDIKVIFYSASYDWQLQRDAFHLGVDAWMVKGVTRLEDIVAKVNELRKA